VKHRLLATDAGRALSPTALEAAVDAALTRDAIAAAKQDRPRPARTIAF
jgi:hypothetical protein